MISDWEGKGSVEMVGLDRSTRCTLKLWILAVGFVVIADPDFHRMLLVYVTESLLHFLCRIGWVDVGTEYQMFINQMLRYPDIQIRHVTTSFLKMF